MKKDNIFWGMFFILGGIFLLLSRLELLGSFSIITLFLTVLFVAWLIRSLKHIEFGGILFSIAFLCILYDDFLGIEQLTPWPILGAAAFVSIGLTIIFKDKMQGNWSSNVYEKRPDGSINRPNGEEVTDNRFTFSNSFSSSVKYVKSDDFKEAKINCSFGEVKVFFDDAMIQQGEAAIHLDVKFGSIELYIPKTWNVINNVSSAFGSVDEKNRSSSNGSPTVILKGDASFGGVTIIYC